MHAHTKTHAYLHRTSGDTDSLTPLLMQRDFTHLSEKEIITVVYSGNPMRIPIFTELSLISYAIYAILKITRIWVLERWLRW